MEQKKKITVGSTTRDNQICLNIIYHTCISHMNNSAEYIKEGCADLIGKSIENVSSTGVKYSLKTALSISGKY
eukprot:15275551-Ditylum_brightwellii.AAC.1